MITSSWSAETTPSAAPITCSAFLSGERYSAEPGGQRLALRPGLTRTLAGSLSVQDTQSFGAKLLSQGRLGVERVNSTVTELDHTQLSDLGASFLESRRPNCRTST